MQQLKQIARSFKSYINALYLVYRNPQTPWYAKVWILGVLAYALSPIDLIPDFIPVVGYLDDLILLPVGIYIAIKLIPPEILQTALEAPTITIDKILKQAGLVLVVLTWSLILLGCAAFIAYLI